MRNGGRCIWTTRANEYLRNWTTSSIKPAPFRSTVQRSTARPPFPSVYLEKNHQ